MLSITFIVFLIVEETNIIHVSMFLENLKQAIHIFDTALSYLVIKFQMFKTVQYYKNITTY